MSFYTFPLCLLATKMGPYELLQNISSYSACQIAASLSTSLSTEELRVEAATLKRPPDGNDLPVIVAFKRLGLNAGSCERTRREHKYVLETKQAWEDFHKPKPDALVTVGSDFLWSLKDEETDMIDFRLVSAVNSLCGHRQQPSIIRRQMLLARMMGCKSPAVLIAENKRRLKRDHLTPPLTISQLRTRLDNMQERGLITRVPADRRNTWFAQGSDFDALLEFVAARKKRSVADLMAKARSRLTTR